MRGAMKMRDAVAISAPADAPDVVSKTLSKCPDCAFSPRVVWGRFSRQFLIIHTGLCHRRSVFATTTEEAARVWEEQFQ